MSLRANMRRMATFVTVLTLMFSSRALLAQTGGIAGKVTDAATGQGIADARVLIRGTTLETVTGKDGEFRFAAVRAGSQVVGTFRLGFKATSDTVRVVAGQTANVTVKMSETSVNLSQVVVTGTAGNQERKAQAALVASVTAADIINSAPVNNVANTLQSQVPGIALSAQSGTVGAATTIRIRGASSVNLSNDPLIFVDGIRANDGTTSSGQSGQVFDRLNDIGPDEIESIEVVKGPAAATLYGADASAGVIQIITKKGKAGQSSFVQTLRIEGGNLVNKWTPPDNYGNCSASLVASTSTNPLCLGQAVGTLVHDNPLLRVGAFKNGSSNVVDWSARGGGLNYGYTLSYGQDKENGILPSNNYTRYNVRSNFNYVPNSKLTIDAGLGLTQADARLPDNDNNTLGWLGGGLLGSPLTRTSLTSASNDGWYGFNRHVAAITNIDHDLLTHRVITNVTANYLPAPWFSNRFTMGMDFVQDQRTNAFLKNDSTWYGGLTDGGQNAQTENTVERYTFDYLGNMRKEWGSKWETNLSFGIQVISTRNTSLGATGIGFVTNANNSVTSAATITGTGTFSEQRQYGYLGQLQIGNENKRFLQLGLRIDKNSSFGAAAPAFVLPKVGGSWAVSEEKFFDKWAKYVSTLRLRAAWGTTGRSPRPGDPLTTLQAATNFVNGTEVAGAIPLNPGNAKLKPEKGTEFEAGVDAGFFKNRVSAELTYFNKKTNDLILAQPIPPSLGFSANPFANIGSVLNSGVELAVNIAALDMRNLRWDVRMGVNTLHNELTSLGGIAPFGLGAAGRTLVGQQLGVYVSKQIQSIDVAKRLVIVNDTLTPMGNLFPTLEWNITNTVTVGKNWRFSALVDAKKNFMVENFTAYFRETQLVRSNLRLDTLALSPYERLRRFGNLTPAPGQGAFTTVKGLPETVSNVIDAYIEPGDFVKFRELSATYTLPGLLLKGMGSYVQSASVTLAMQNIKIWTRYSGSDPELNAQAGAFSRQDFLTLPNAQKTVLRVNLSF
jgi:TonB-dependent starch-binding outer membrane protein SusC